MEFREIGGKTTEMGKKMSDKPGDAQYVLPEKPDSIPDLMDDLYKKLSEDVDELERRITEELESHNAASGPESVQEAADGTGSSADRQD